MKYLNKLALKLVALLWCHRATYSGLSASHAFAGWWLDKPEVYWPIALLYLALVAQD